MATTAGAAVTHAAYAQSNATPTEQTHQASPTGDGHAGRVVDPTTGIEELIVTARRVEERAQDVPVTVTALTPTLMRKGDVYDSYTILSQVPAIQNFTKIRGNAQLAGLTRIRGVTGVGYYFADTPYPGAQWNLYAPFFDVQNVQVLKGPQGTLFGLASDAGAIVATPQKPGNSFGGYTKGSAGNYNFRELEAAIDIPIVQDMIMLRASGKSSRRGGYVKDIIGGTAFGDENYDIGRLSLVVKPSSRLENTTIFQAEVVRNTPQAASALGDLNMTDDYFNSASGRTQAAVNGMTVAEWRAARDRALGDQLAIGRYRVQGWSIGCLNPYTRSTVPGPNFQNVIPQSCSPGQGRMTNYGVFNTTVWNATDNITLKNILSHVWGRNHTGSYDTDDSRLILLDADPKVLGSTLRLPSTLSEELQLSGTFGDLNFVAGATYYSEKIKPLDIEYSTFGFSLNSLARKTRSENRSKGLYGQINYDLAGIGLAGLTASAGLRHSWDSSFLQVNTLSETTGQVIAVQGGRGTPNGEGSWEATDYTLGLKYQVSPDVMIFFNNSRGHNRGGLQNVPAVPRFDPEKLTNYEFGLKSQAKIGDLGVTFNGSGYYGKLNGAQVVTVVYTPTGPQQGFANATANAATATIKGFEAEVSLAYRNLSLRGFVSYSNAKYTRYDSFDAARQPLDLSNTPFYNSPPWKFGISPTYAFDFDPDTEGDVSLSLNYTFTDSFWANTGKPLTPSNPSIPNTGAICKARRTAANGYGPLSADGGWAYKDCAPASDNLNLIVDWSNVLGHRGVDLTLTVTNLMNNDDIIGINTTYDSALNFVTYLPNRKRMIWATVRYSF
jgi:iron complex outermembrane receptor protein